MSLVVVAAALAIPALGLVHPQGIPTHADAVTVAATNFLSPYSTGMPASIVIGQLNFTTRGSGVSATNFSNLDGPSVEADGYLWVGDLGGHRVLAFPEPFRTGEAATLVIGQPNLASSGLALTAKGIEDPAGIAFDSAGDLFVSDWIYHRVLEFKPPFSSGMAASVVIGQTSFTTSTTSVTASSFTDPNRIAFSAAGDLFVPDTSANRVLVFDPPFTTGMPASAVLGQSTFIGSTGGTTATNLSFPRSVTVSSTTVWVGDTGNARIVGYPLPATTGEAATAVLGQASLTATGGSGANATSDVVGMTTDSSGDLFAADYLLNRVVEFTPPFTPFKAPALVVGEPSLTVTTGGASAATVTNPTGLSLGSDGTLWVSDSGNNRVLGFVPTEYAASFAETGLPAGSAWGVTFDGQPNFGSSGQINVPAINGTYSWTVGQAPPDYHLTSALTGTVTVNGSTAVVSVTFAQNSSSSSSSNLTLGLVIGAVVGLVVGIGAGVLIGRRGKGKASTVAPWPGSGGAPPSTPPPAGPVPPPSTGGAPPPGASQ